MEKILSVFGVVVAVVGFVAFVAIAIGVWPVTAELRRRTDGLLDGADAALDRAEPVASTLLAALSAAQAELNQARPPESAPKLAPVPKLLLRSALKESPGRVESAARATEVMGDLLAALTVALGALQDTPGVRPLETGELAPLQQKLKTAAEHLRTVTAILGPAAPGSDAIAAEDASTIEKGLAAAHTITTEATAEIATLRERIAAFREGVHQRLTLACWAIFALALVGAVGQIALMRWCVACLRGGGELSGAR
jgi:nitrate reductase NapE component